MKDIYALIGNPVGHSLSPAMHNRAYREMGIDACYVAFEVTDLKGAVSGIRALGIKGVSVTIPFKTAVLTYLDEIEEEALALGAVNTIINEKGYLRGTNTDWWGVVLALREVMEISGKTFVIVGAGGTAQAALYGIRKEGGNPIIVNRTPEKGRVLAERVGCPFYPLEELKRLKADCLINTTPVGMYPHVDVSPVEAEVLKNFPYVMDVIYNPLTTKLLREARAQGAVTILGLSMFVYQGARQITLWTKGEPPLWAMREEVLKHLQKET